MRGGQDERVLQQALNRLRAEPTLAELETLLAFLARFVLDTPFIQRLMRWDMAILRESPWYQEIAQEVVEQRREEWVHEGIERSRRQTAEHLLHALEHRLGEAPAEVQAVLLDLSLDQLWDLFDAALTVTTWTELQAHLPTREHGPELSTN